MSLRGFIIGLSSLALLVPALKAQSADHDLPAAPSTAQQSQQAPKPSATTPKPADPPQTQSEPAKAGPSEPVQSSPTETAEPAAAAAPKSNAAVATSAPASSTDDQAETTIRRFVNEVNVVFTVTDKHGRYVKDLRKNDFKVIDDSQPASEIRSFHSETDLPLQVGLLVDASNSVRDRFKFEQESAIEFLNQTVRPKYDKAFVLGFDVTADLTQDFTDNTEALSRGVRALRPGGGTAMYDALYKACRDKLLKAAETQTGPARRAVILLSDGDDNQSRVTREEAIEMAQRAEVVVYTISTNVTGARGKYDKVLERIAEATGGRAFFPFQLTDVANAFAEIQDELRSQYAISYKPAEFKTDGRYRTIEILAQNHKNLRVRSRRGYYAPSE